MVDSVLPEHGFVFGFLSNVLCEALEKSWVLSLVDGAEHGGRGPAPGVHHRTISYPENITLFVVTSN